MTNLHPFQSFTKFQVFLPTHQGSSPTMCLNLLTTSCIINDLQQVSKNFDNKVTKIHLDFFNFKNFDNKVRNTFGFFSITWKPSSFSCSTSEQSNCKRNSNFVAKHVSWVFSWLIHYYYVWRVTLINLHSLDISKAG